MPRKISRRILIKNGMIVATFLMPTLQLIGSVAQAGDLPALDLSDPTAKALGFVADAHEAANAKPNQNCSTCAQFQGKAGDAAGGCNIFAGKNVPALGWCSVYVQKA